jgi:hypothetical protein
MRRERCVVDQGFQAGVLLEAWRKRRLHDPESRFHLLQPVLMLISLPFAVSRLFSGGVVLEEARLIFQGRLVVKPPMIGFLV